jgi:hypothetical protein
MDPGHLTALPADLTHLGMQVTPENVVQVSAVLRAESDYLRDKLENARYACRVGEPGQDPVSPRAATGFNTKIESLLEQCRAYRDALRAASDLLAATARAYGHTDDDIARTLDAVQSGYGRTGPLLRPSPESPMVSVLGPYLHDARPTPEEPSDLGPTIPNPTGEWTPLAPPPGSRR